jgi:2-C-methyl-D-erythritol 4-phosphate cytidylyltransferase/2-C-methyl-D-erythritol 2,4-cyclodiphosphate synthase
MLIQTLLALRPMMGRPDAAGLLVVVSPEDVGWVETGCSQRLRDTWGPSAPVLVAPIGGASRADSVLSGLALLAGLDATEADWVAVHDAARPGLSRLALDRLLDEGLGSEDGALLALPVPDTLKRSAGAGAPEAPIRAVDTLDRTGLWAAQTPQLFPLHRLRSALEGARAVTDEASAMEQAGARPLLVMGETANRKYTFVEDFEDHSRMPSNANTAPPWPRVGTGFDVHALVEGRALIIGGVTIPHSRGLLGHSDADVLLHAISDAILGAAGLGDIGKHFPDSDAQYKGADSRVLLRSVVERVQAAGLQVFQIDATIIAQAPKMAPHIPQMMANLTADTRAPWVNVKATTTEHLGFTGREEGIAAQASAVLVPRED